MDIKVYFSSYREIEHQLQLLSTLAQAFSLVGNSEVFNNLFDIKEWIAHNLKNIDEFVKNEQKERLHDAQQMSATVLKSCLAGIETAKKAKTQA